MNQQERRLYLIRELLQETQEPSLTIPTDFLAQKQLLRGLMNIRPPRPISQSFLRIQDAYLQEEQRKKGIVTLDTLSPIQPSIYLWRGDITTLSCDAIVNAANSGMTGCYVPNHHCIDNCIHTFSGVQLRLVCANLMQQQGYAEPTGQAKITPVYNLPCRYILHTVGPIISGRVSRKDRAALASCYHSCLELAAAHQLESVAFCCISTGEFHFPNEQAAEIAVQTVQQFLRQETSVKQVIFNVFKDVDQAIYKRLLRTD